MTEPSNLRDAAEVTVTEADREAVKAYYVENGFIASQRNLEAHFARHRAAVEAATIAKMAAWLRRAGEHGSERAQIWGETFADAIEAGEWKQ